MENNMENIFAVIENNVVKDTVISDEQEILRFFYPEADAIIPVTEETGPASAGFEYRNKKFIPISPFVSWVFNETTWTWEAPAPKPELQSGEYAYWDESKLSWIIDNIPEV